MKIKNVLVVCGVYIATLIGAGFASGQEVLQFFVIYGSKSIFGIVLSSIGFGLAATAILDRTRISEIDDFAVYLKKLMGRHLAVVVDWIITIFMFTVFCVMAAGSGAVVAQLMGVPFMAGANLMCLACFFCFIFNIKGVMALNSVLAPLLIFGIIFCSINILLFREINVFSGTIKAITNSWVTSGITYVSYNVLTAAVILVSVRGYINTRKEAKWVGIISSSALAIVLVSIWAVLKIYYGKINLGEVPMLTLVIRQGRYFGAFYSIILFMAMVTTAVANGYGVIHRLCCVCSMNRMLITIGVCVVGFAGAGVGFSNLVGNVYRLCGYAGLVLLVMIFIDMIKIKITK